MRLLLIRHAIALERNEFSRTGKDDALRPLSDDGRKKMKLASRGLRELVPDIDLLATSPLTRAAQTGAILDSVYGGLKEVEIAELSPGASLQAFLAWLKRQKGDTVAVVGHEPWLSRLACRLLTGTEGSFLAFRKGGAALLELPGAPGPGIARLVWMLTPSQLRSLGTR